MNKHYTFKGFIYILFLLSAAFGLCWISVFKGGLSFPNWFSTKPFDANESFLACFLILSFCGANFLAFIRVFFKS